MQSFSRTILQLTNLVTNGRKYPLLPVQPEHSVDLRQRIGVWSRQYSKANIYHLKTLYNKKPENYEKIQRNICSKIILTILDNHTQGKTYKPQTQKADLQIFTSSRRANLIGTRTNIVNNWVLKPRYPEM